MSMNSSSASGTSNFAAIFGIIGMFESYMPNSALYISWSNDDDVEKYSHTSTCNHLSFRPGAHAYFLCSICFFFIKMGIQRICFHFELSEDIKIFINFYLKCI